MAVFMTAGDLPADLISVAGVVRDYGRVLAQAGARRIPPRVGIDGLFVQLPGQPSPRTVVQRVQYALPTLRRYHSGGVVTLVNAKAAFSGTTDQSFNHMRLDWGISVADPRGFGTGYSTIDPRIIAELAEMKEVNRTPASHVKQFIEARPSVFTIDEGPAPGLVDSDSAYQLAEDAGGAVHRTASGARLESAALTTRAHAAEPLWAFRYGDDLTPDRLTVILNALSGHVLWVGVPPTDL